MLSSQSAGHSRSERADHDPKDSAMVSVPVLVEAAETTETREVFVMERVLRNCIEALEIYGKDAGFKESFLDALVAGPENWDKELEKAGIFVRRLALVGNFQDDLLYVLLEFDKLRKKDPAAALRFGLRFRF